MVIYQVNTAMNIQEKKDLVDKWEKYFPGCEMPIAVYFSDSKEGLEFPDAPKPSKEGYTCIFAQLNKVRRGTARAFSKDNIGCFAAKGMLGFIKSELDDNMINFLTKVECFKKSEAAVREMAEMNPPLEAEKEYLIFKPVDQLTEEDAPLVITVFANADVISCLHSLANYDNGDPNNVFAPFGSGCDTLIGFPLKEIRNNSNRAVVGGFDIAMRNCVKKDIMTFSAPYSRFMELVSNMDSSFLNTYIWGNIKPRVAK